MASSHIGRVTVGGEENRRLAHSLYGVCSTPASTAAKAVTMYTGNKTLQSTWTPEDLYDGLTVTVRFTNQNTVASPTLNVNGSGAKPIYKYATGTSDLRVAPRGWPKYTWDAGNIVDFTYDTSVNEDGCWIMHLDKEDVELNVPDVNLILEYSTWCGDSDGIKNELGLGGLCYIGNGRYVFYLRNNKTVNDVRTNQGRLVCISMLWNSTTQRYEKKFIWRTEPFQGYHGNSLAYVPTNSSSGTIYGALCQQYVAVSSAHPSGQDKKDGWFKCSVSNTGTTAPTSFTFGFNMRGSNLAYDRITGKFISFQGSWGPTKGRINIYAEEPNGTVSDFKELAAENSSNKEIVNLIQNGWYQGCFAENGIFYAIFWRTYSAIIAFDIKTGKYLHKWNLPRYSNLCKVMDEIQDLTYDFDSKHFIISSITRSIRLNDCPIVNISQIGLYESLAVAVPSRNFANQGTGNFYTDSIYSARIELGVNSGDSPSTNPNSWRNDCTPCCDRTDNEGNYRYNFFRTIKDADYAFQNYHPGGGKIKYIITNAFSNTVNSAYAHFYKPCIITTQTGKTLTLSVPFFETSNFIFIQGESSSNKININTWDTDSGYNNQSVIRIQDGSQLILENVNFTSQAGSLSYGVHVTNHAKLEIGQNVTAGSSVARVSNNMMTCTPTFSPASGVTVSAQGWKKVQNIVTADLTLVLSSSVAANGSKVIGTVADGGRPDHTVSGNTRTTTTFIRSSITTSGTVTLATATSLVANSTVYATFNYISST